MLIENRSLAVGDVACVRLVTGEEVVGRVTYIPPPSSPDETLVITKPIQLQIHVDPKTGNVAGVGFAPFMVGVPEDNKFVIKRQHMLVDPMKARPDIAENYTKATSSIELPKKSSLIV